MDTLGFRKTVEKIREAFSSPRARDIFIVISVFAASRLFYYKLGVRFDTSTALWFIQFIDPMLLVTRLSESILYYHASAPMLNLVTGLVLKLFPESFTAVFAIMYLAFGLVLAVSLYLLMEALGVQRVLRVIICSLYIAGPGVVLYENWLMYTYPTVAMLVLAAMLLHLFVRTERVAWGAAFFSVLALVVLTRSLFHIAWFMVITIGLIAILKGRRKQVLAVALIPVLVVVLWHGKNLVMFGKFANSAMLGLSLNNITTLQVPREKLEPLVEKGVLSGYALRSRYADMSIMMGEVRFTATGKPVLDDVYRSTGYLNLNHISMIEINRQYTRDALKVLRLFPGSYAKGVLTAHKPFFSPASLNEYFTDKNIAVVRPVQRVYDLVFFGAWAEPKTFLHNFGYDFGYMPYHTAWFIVIGFPLSFAYGVWRLACLRGRPLEAIVLMFVLFTCAYVYLVGTLVDLGENYRYRFLAEPLTLALLGTAIGDLWRRYSSGRLTLHR